MGDYSPHVLERARQEVAHHGDHVWGLVLEATRLAGSVGFLGGKAFLVYISNVYDNLPSDEVATIRARDYLVQARAFLPGAAADAIAARFALDRAEIAPLTSRLLRIGPELLAESLPERFGDTGQAVSFWQAAWDALRQAERYVPLEGLDTYQVTPALTGEILRPLLSAEGDIRMHVSNGALASFADTLPLLHPFGRIVCHDLFTTGAGQYRAGFYGPGKYDGSVVNWVNGPLLASRRGFDVRFSPFAQRPGSRVKTLTAQVRDWRGARPGIGDPERGGVAEPPPHHRGGLLQRPRVARAAQDRVLPAADQRGAPGGDPRGGDQGRDQGLGAGRHRHRLRRRAAPGQRHRLLPGAHPRRAHPAAGQGGLLRLLRGRGHRQAARRRRRDARPRRRLPPHGGADQPAGQVLLLQIDEPFLAGYPEQVALAVEAVNIVRADVPVTWALHVCYGNRYARPSWEGHYDFLFPAVLDARVDQLVLEFARKGLDDLRLIKEYAWPSWLGLGVIDVKSPAVEPAGLVAARVMRALEYMPPDRLMVNPDCGLRHLAPEVARRKLRAMVTGTAMVRAELGLPAPSPEEAPRPQENSDG